MEVKLCKRCNLEKNITEFTKNKRRKDGLDLYCRECNKIRSIKSNHDSHIDMWLNINNKAYCSVCNSYIDKSEYYKKRGCCKSCTSIKDKNYYTANKEIKNKQSKIYQNMHKDRLKLWHDNYRKENKHKTKEYCQSEHGKSIRRIYSKKYYKEVKSKDINFKISDRISYALRYNLKKGKKHKHWENICNYTKEDLKNKLESTLPEGKTWQNFLNGEFHIDHIIPISYFNYTSIYDLDFILCWRLENLQLLTTEDNLSKSNRLDLDYQQSLLKEIRFYRKYPEMYRG